VGPEPASPPLINGTVDLANASREMKPEEIAEAKQRGIEPVEFTVATDAIAVVVNPLNPVDELTIDQVADIYTGKVDNWSEIGETTGRSSCCPGNPIRVPTCTSWKNVIRRGDPTDPSLFSPETLLMPSSEGISNEIRQNPNAIGYDGLGYVTPDQKTIAVSVGAGKPFAGPAWRA